jgi:NAD(P)-dependent dehydrogenase (short-subunit alcohol dehydrogenase family)
MLLEGRVALVTGASRGIGAAIARAFAAEGATLVLCARSEGVDTVARELATARHPARAMRGDISDPAFARELIGSVRKEHGRLDVLVNNAGVAPLYPSIDAVSEAFFDKVIDVNLKGPFRLTAIAAPRMIAGGGGSIINVSSIGAHHPQWSDLPYAAAKAGLESLTIGFAGAYGPSVRVNTIAVGPFLTDISAAWDVESFERFASQRYPLGRLGQPPEIVGTALYLASDMSTFTTGSTITVDGGVSIASPFPSDS